MASTAKRPLEEYERKRDFRRTAEPKGRPGAPRSRRGRPRFVVQQHDASRLHYDFRLEVDGVMKSWAVPKGPSIDPKEKRLAVPTEDHPLEYRDFEGTIAKGEYGAGTVVVWDAGTFRNTTERKGESVPIDTALTNGHATFVLEGRKLRGGFALTRFKTGKDEAWLLVKMDDDEADSRREPTRDEPRSVLTGRTLEEVAARSGRRGRRRS
jgi:DNA ligase D-like protein (predicted 3'-phosphoesterase)